MDAQTILDGKDWVLPHLYDGRAEMQKPPLYYWLVAGISKLRGGEVDAWAVRLPPALAALGCVGVLCWLGWARGRLFEGILAGTALATALHFTWLARIGRVDMPLTFAVAVVITAFHLANYRQRLLYLLLGYVAIAVAVLLKGPIGLALPAAVLAANAVLEGCVQKSWLAMLQAAFRGKGLWWGVPLVLALSMPWFLWANYRTGGEFFRVFIWEHNVERGLGGGVLRSHPFWYYVPLFASDFLPWSPLLLVAFFLAWKFDLLRTDPEARLGLAWFAGVFVLLSCAQYKRPDYLLPAYPGAALFLSCVARRFEAEWRNWTRRPHWLSYSAIHATLCTVMVAGWFYHVHVELAAAEPFRDYRAFAAEVRQRVPRPDPVVFFRTEAHPLAFHVGQPLEVLVEWQELNARLLQSGPRYVVMPPDCVAEIPQNLHGVRLEEITSNSQLAGGAHERPLVLLRAERMYRVARNP